MATSMLLSLTSKSEKTLEMMKKVGVLNDKDVSNKVKQANLALELLGRALSTGALSSEEIKKLLSNN
jgi:hypothetical protein